MYINQLQCHTLSMVLPSLLKLISRLDMLLQSTGRERRAKREQSEAKNGNTQRWVVFQHGVPSQTSGR